MRRALWLGVGGILMLGIWMGVGRRSEPPRSRMSIFWNVPEKELVPVSIVVVEGHRIEPILDMAIIFGGRMQAIEGNVSKGRVPRPILSTLRSSPAIEHVDRLDEREQFHGL